MTGTLSSYVHDIQTAYRFQSSNSVCEVWISTWPSQPWLIPLVALWQLAGCFKQEKLFGERWYGSDRLHEQRLYIESNSRHSLRWVSWRRTAMPFVLALPWELVMIPGSERAMLSLLCTRGGETETRCWRTACSACCLHPQRGTWRRFLPLPHKFA